MAEIMLLCHGVVKDASTFVVPDEFVLWHIGIPGHILPADNAHAIVDFLKADPTDPEKAAEQNGITVTKFTGEGTTGPNFALRGDDLLPTQFYDFITGTTTELDAGWRSDLGRVVTDVAHDHPGPNNLFVLCCWNL